MAITKRQMMILKAIIDDYIITGMPVGSRTLSKREDMSYSSATIRNEMSDLEEAGYLEQPHTSAGRMPSEKAYRLYVDTLMNVSSLNEEEIRFVQEYLGKKIGQIENVTDAIAKVLSELTNLTALVLAPQLYHSEINRIQIVPIGDKRALVVLVFSTGVVEDVLIPVPDGMEVEYYEMMSNMLTDIVSGKKASEALRDLRGAMQGQMEAHRQFMDTLLEVALNDLKPKAAKGVVLGGTQKIFNHPEYQDVEKARDFLTLLETKDTLYELLMGASDMEFTVKIGTENELEELKDMSFVTATYRINEGQVGSFGVIGPTRMNYGRILSVLQFVGASMNEIFNYYIEEE